MSKTLLEICCGSADDALEAHKRASGRGLAPEGSDLSHFETTPEDELRAVETPAGPIEVLFLKNRADFETFLRIVGHKAQPVDISPAVGAMTAALRISSTTASSISLSAKARTDLRSYNCFITSFITPPILFFS